MQVSPLLQDAKKGENDPFLSLKTRKARITGEWRLTSGTVSETENTSSGSNTYLTTYTSTTRTIDGNTISYRETLTIEKDGTFNVERVADGGISVVSGNWFFSGKNKEADLRNKEAIVFKETAFTSNGGAGWTNTGVYGDEILLIDQLKNKEMIFKGSTTYQILGGDSGSSSYDKTFEKQ